MSWQSRHLRAGYLGALLAWLAVIATLLLWRTV